MQFDLEYRGNDRGSRLLYDKLKYLFGNIDESNLTDTFKNAFASAQASISQLAKDVKNLLTDVSDLKSRSSTYVTLTGAQNITDKRYNGMGIIRIATGSNYTRIILKRADTAASYRHASGFLMCDQNGDPCAALLCPLGSVFLENHDGWTVTYDGEGTYTIEAGKAAMGYFLAFDTNGVWSVRYEE